MSCGVLSRGNGLWVVVKPGLVIRMGADGLVKESCCRARGEVGVVIAATSVGDVASVFGWAKGSLLRTVCCWGGRDGALISHRGSNVVGTIRCDDGGCDVKGWGLEGDAIGVRWVNGVWRGERWSVAISEVGGEVNCWRRAVVRSGTDGLTTVG